MCIIGGQVFSLKVDFVLDEMGQEKQLCETWDTRCFLNTI